VTAEGSKTAITVTWGKPPVGVLNSQSTSPDSTVLNDYNVYRFELTKAGAMILASKLRVGGTNEPTRSFADTTAKTSTMYVYFVNAAVKANKNSSEVITTGYGQSKPAQKK